MKDQQKPVPSFKEESAKINAAVDALPAEAKGTINKEAEDLKSNYSKDLLQLKVGEKAPDFSLKNAVGKNIRLYDLLSKNRVVLTFYRGTWCPYCNLQLSQYQQVLFKLKSIGSMMVAISPQTPDESLNMKEKNNLSFEVLSDPGNQIAKRFTTVIKKSDDYTRTISEMGKAFHDHYTDESGEVPVPAVFIIDQDGIILFAKSEGGDYRERVETKEVLDVLSKKS